jgi:hypothetical protein
LLIIDAKTREETRLDKQTHGETRCQINQDASLSAQQRNQQVVEVQGRIMALQSNHAVDPIVLVAAHAEHGARAQLAAQVERNRAAARSRLVDEASDDEG